MTTAHYRFSVRTDMIEKRMREEYDKATHMTFETRPPRNAEEKKAQSKVAGTKSSYGWQTVDWTMEELAQHVATGNAMAVSVLRAGHRVDYDVLETNILGLDFENGGVTVEDLLEDPLMQQIAGLIMPSASDTPEDPRARVFVPLSRSVTGAEYKAIAETFIHRLYPGKIDSAASDFTRFFFGAVKTERVIVDDDAFLDVDAFLDYYRVNVQPTVLTMPKYEHDSKDVTDNGLRSEILADWQNQKRAKNRSDRGIVYMLAIFDHLQRTQSVMDYDTWLKFRFAYQDFTGATDEAFWAMAKHPYWNAEWTESEWAKWQTDLPRTWGDQEGINGGYLVWLAKRLGALAHNPLDLQSADMTIYDWSEMPQGSYLLKADMGTGKTQIQREAIESILKAERRVIFVVNTKQLARAAYGRFADLKPTLYIDENDKILPTWQLKQAMFLIVVAQTFGTKVVTKRQDVMGLGLVIIDEVQQIVAASVQTDNSVWKGTQQREFDHTVRLLLENEVEIHGLDAGINEQTRARFPGVPVIHYAAKIQRPKVTVYNRYTPLLELLDTERRGLTVVASDTKDAALGTVALAKRIAETLPKSKVLRIDHDTVTPGSRDFDFNAVRALMKPDDVMPDYTHIVYSPAAQSGLSVQFPVEIVLHFATFLVPKDNQQLMARFRKAKSIHTYYRNYRGVGMADEYEAKLKRAKVLLTSHMVERTEVSRGLDELTELGERDEMYQSIAPRDLYVALLERAGYSVVMNYTSGKDSKLERLEAVDTTEFEDNHWQDFVDEPEHPGAYSPDEMAAHRNATHIIRTVGEAALSRDIVPNPVQLSKDAREFKPSQVNNAYIMSGGEADFESEIATAINGDIPLSRQRAYVKRLTLMHMFKVLGYEGEDTIPAQLLADNGEAAWQHLNAQRELWDAAVSVDKQWATINDRVDHITALRSMIKYMLGEWLGLKVSQGKNTRVLNPITGKQIRDIQVDGWRELEHLVYVYSHSKEKLTVREERIAKLVNVVFDKKALEAQLETMATLLEWFANQPKPKQRQTVALIRGKQMSLNEIIDTVNGGAGIAGLDHIQIGHKADLNRQDEVNREALEASVDELMRSQI